MLRPRQNERQLRVCRVINLDTSPMVVTITRTESGPSGLRCANGVLSGTTRPGYGLPALRNLSLWGRCWRRLCVWFRCQVRSVVSSRSSKIGTDSVAGPCAGIGGLAQNASWSRTSVPPHRRPGRLCPWGGLWRGAGLKTAPWSGFGRRTSWQYFATRSCMAAADRSADS